MLEQVAVCVDGSREHVDVVCHWAGGVRNLAPFRAIAVDAAAMIDKGDLPGAKTRINGLETSWDEAEAGLKPRAAAEWNVIDKAIDRALTAVRGSTPDPAMRRQVLADLLATVNGAPGKT